MKYIRTVGRVDAFQMTNKNRKNKADWPSWLQEALEKPSDEIGSVRIDDNHLLSDGKKWLSIRTAEGVMTVEADDWLIRDEHGSIYPNHPDTFKSIYVPADFKLS